MLHTAIQEGNETEGGSVLKVKGALFLLLSCLAAVAAWVSGCTDQRLQLVRTDDLFVEVISSSLVCFSTVTAKQEGEELLITGELSRRKPSFSGVGRVDVAVVSPGGMVIDKASVPYTPQILPKTPGARKHHCSHFEVRLHSTPPQGSVIRVAYHAGAASGDLAPDGENLALPEDIDYGG